jgi:protein ImuB
VLWLCLHLPDLPLDVFGRGLVQDQPIAVTSRDRRPIVVACNARARALGMAPGMAAVAALALAPQTLTRLRDEAAEAAALRAVAGWALQFASTVSIEPAATAAVVLDIEGSLRLFGGLRRLVGYVRTGIAALGYAARFAVAPTPAAAALLARAGDGVIVQHATGLPDALAPLPLALLPGSHTPIETLADMGIDCIGEALRLPRDGFARRFGQALLDALDRAHGRLPDPRLSFTPPERFESRLLLPAPVIAAEALLFAAQRLLAECCGWLVGRGLGLMRFAFALEHEDTPAPTVVAINLSAPSREAAHLLRTVRERFTALALPGRVEAIALRGLEVATLAGSSRSLPLPDPASPLLPDPASPLLPDPASAETAHALLDRLCARLGDDAVLGIATAGDHRPEHAWQAARPAAMHGGRTGPTTFPSRPLWLLDPPRPIPAARATGDVLVLLDGPERIETGWWDGRDVRRDYFVARTADGERLWLFRADDNWFIHGIFG